MDDVTKDSLSTEDAEAHADVATDMAFLHTAGPGDGAAVVALIGRRLMVGRTPDWWQQ